MAGVALAGLASLTFLGGKTPGSVAFMPDHISCSNPASDVVLTLELPTGVTRVIWEAHLGGVDGPVISSSIQSPPMGDYYKVAPGQWRQEVTGAEAAGGECRQGVGRYGIVLRDADSGTLLAATVYTIEP